MRDADDEEYENINAVVNTYVDPVKESRIYWGYWASTTEGVVTTTISLHGTEILGSPFTVAVEKEAEVFTSALPYVRLGPMPVDTERGVCTF